ncbi:MAG TPA: hypothetical protein VNU19_06885 [Candidatus Acidoferrum sp.]|jgi:hypothetical protein|nr:hypothetical protein [Candidatus Acidoferrum sp.]
MFVIARLARPFVALTCAAVLFGPLAALPAQATETGTFVGQKICRVPFVAISPPNPGGYCLINEANLPFLLGAKDYYTDPTVTLSSTGALAVVSSPVTIMATDERGSTASGNCTYYYPSATNPVGHGLCVYSRGTGYFYGFNAVLTIGSPTPTGVSVVGPYWFDRDHGNGGN